MISFVRKDEVMKDLCLKTWLLKKVFWIFSHLVEIPQHLGNRNSGLSGLSRIHTEKLPWIP